MISSQTTADVRNYTRFTLDSLIKFYSLKDVYIFE